MSSLFPCPKIWPRKFPGSRFFMEISENSWIVFLKHCIISHRVSAFLTIHKACPSKGNHVSPHMNLNKTYKFRNNLSGHRIGKCPPLPEFLPDPVFQNRQGSSPKQGGSGISGLGVTPTLPKITPVFLLSICEVQERLNIAPRPRGPEGPKK